MDREGLLLGMAAVFAGITVLLAVVGAVIQPFVLAVAVPFAVVTYIMYGRATGKFGDRRDVRAEARQRARNGVNARTGRRTGGPSKAADSPSGSAGESASKRHSPTRGEAYQVLGLPPGADDDAVTEAYRELVKETHPDTPGGDEERFKRVKRAYETLQG